MRHEICPWEAALTTGCQLISITGLVANLITEQCAPLYPLLLPLQVRPKIQIQQTFRTSELRNIQLHFLHRFNSMHHSCWLFSSFFILLWFFTHRSNPTHVLYGTSVPALHPWHGSIPLYLNWATLVSEQVTCVGICLMNFWGFVLYQKWREGSILQLLLWLIFATLEQSLTTYRVVGLCCTVFIHLHPAAPLFSSLRSLTLRL